MAYQLDNEGTVVINIDQGIAPDPYSGTSDARSVNLSTIPNEASVSFSGNAVVTAPVVSAQSASASAAGDNITFATSTPLEIGQAIYFTNNGGTNISTSSIWWVSGSSYSGGNNVITIDNTYGSSGIFNITSDGTVIFSVIPLTLGPRGQISKNYMVEDQKNHHWLADSNGFVWSDLVKTSGGTGITSTSSWTYTGNVGRLNGTPNADPNAYGNGLVYFQPVNNSAGPVFNNFDGYIFLFRQQQIDYLKVVNAGSSISAGSLSWQSNWQSSANLNLYLLWGGTTAYPHEAIQDPSGRIVFTDGYVLGCFYQNSVNTNFDPVTSSTYTYIDTAPSASIPPTDIGMCLSYMPTQQYIVGGTRNVAYVYDAFTSGQSTSPLLQSVCLIPENLTQNIITVGNNTFLFSGNRGRIYIYNGSQASPYAKVPDHLSNTVFPQFGWGAVTSVNNILYFGIYQVSSGLSLSSTNVYGGVWALDLSTNRIYNSNNLTTDNKDYCCLLFPMIATDPGLLPYAGNGIIAGWNSSTSYNYYGSSGVFASTTSPYTGGQSWVTTELIPIGTLLNPMTPLQIEFKLSKPLVNGETVTIKTGKYFDPTYASFVTQFTTDTTGIISDSTANHNAMQDEAFQWIIVQAILTSTASNPSYCHLTQIQIVEAGEKVTGFYGLS